MREWLSGRASPCQGERREFESRLPLQIKNPVVSDDGIFVFSANYKGFDIMIERYTSENNIINSITAISRKVIDGSCDVHSHEFYEIEYIISGSGKYIIDGKEYPMEPGTVFFMSPVNFHKVIACNAEIYNIMFSEGSCDFYYLARLALNTNASAYKCSDDERSYFEGVLDEMVRDKNDAEMCSLLLTGIIAKLGKSIPKSETGTMSPSHKAILYIITNFRSHITLTDVAKHTGFAPSYISGLFRKQTGIGFKQYLNSVRFECAKNLLLYSDLSITQVCIDSGFDDYANFIRRFKERYGMSPSVYRKNKRGEVKKDAD